MARVRLISEKSDDLTDEQVELFDRIVSSRGSMIRPYEVMLNSPGIAAPMSDLGGQIRFASSLSDHDRELAIMATGARTGCRFEWDSHRPIALAAGVRPQVLAYLENRSATVNLTELESTLIGFIDELTETARVTESTFEAVRSRVGDRAVVDLASTVGYYTMLAYVMGATEAC